LAERWSAELLFYGLTDRKFITRLNDRMANLLYCSDGQMLCNEINTAEVQNEKVSECVVLQVTRCQIIYSNCDNE